MDVETMQKMILRFLMEKKISKNKLLKTLGITIVDLEQLLSYEVPSNLMLQINLPLIKLYCKTKWT